MPNVLTRVLIIAPSGSDLKVGLYLLNEAKAQ